MQCFPFSTPRSCDERVRGPYRCSVVSKLTWRGNIWYQGDDVKLSVVPNPLYVFISRSGLSSPHMLNSSRRPFTHGKYHSLNNTTILATCRHNFWFKPNPGRVHLKKRWKAYILLECSRRFVRGDQLKATKTDFRNYDKVMHRVCRLRCATDVAMVGDGTKEIY